MQTHSSEPYRVFIDRLRRAMFDDYVAANRCTNPVALCFERMPPDDIGYVIQQYSFFPRIIVSLLHGARTAARSAGWTAVDRELTRNLGEELGTETDGVPHAEMLLRGIESGLGLTGVRATGCGPGTEKFLAAMRVLFAPSDRIGYVAGAAYALEASAVPELKIVLSVVDRFRVLRGLVGDDYDALVRFFDAHLVRWEPRHEAGLRSACRAHLDSIEARRSFETGFHAVMASMDDWWKALAAEPAGQQP